MQKSRNPLLLVWIIFLVNSVACHSSRPNFEADGVLCGVDPSAIPSDHGLLKLMSPTGVELTPQQLTVTQARYWDTAQKVHDLRLTRKACAFLPKDAQLVQAFSLNPKAQLTLRLPEDASRPRFLQENLRTPPGFQAELLCPSDGWFAHEKLDFPVRLAAEGDLSGLRFRLIARQELTQKDIELFQKPVGMSLTAWPRSLDTSKLPDGSYTLRYEVTQNFQGWDQTEGSSTTFCPLVVLHKAPAVKGRTELVQGGKAVLARGEALPWTGNDALTQISVCKEPGGTDEDDLSSDNQLCEAKSTCQNSRNFVNIFGQTAEDIGVFHYFIKAKDRTGRESDTLCQRVIVTDQQNFLSLDWNEAQWNQPAAVMSPVRPGFEATVRVRHQEQLDQDILDRLQCKVDFLINGLTTLPGKDVICSKGRCQGQSLESWRPCDAHIAAGISSFFTNQNTQASLMRLHVKAEDGAGHGNEIVRSVWIHPQRFATAIDKLYPSRPDGAAANSMARSSDAYIFAAFYPHVGMRSVSDPKWRLALMPFNFDYKSSQVFQGADGFVYAMGVGQATDHGKAPFDLAVWNGERFELLPTHPRLQECVFTMQRHPVKGLWCGTSSDVLHYHDGRWDDLEWPLENGLSGEKVPCGIWSSYGSTSNQADRLGQLWTRCNDGRLMTKIPGQTWETINAETSWGTQLIVDEQSRLWTLFADWKQGFFEVKTRVYTGHAVKELSSFHVASHRSPDLILLSDSRLLVADYFWNESSSSWERLKGFASVFPDENPIVFETIEKKLAVMARSGVLQWQAGSFRLFPHGWFNLSNFVSSRNLVSFVTDDEVLFQATALRANSALYRMVEKSWNSMGSEVGLFDKASSYYIQKQWFELDGSSTFLMSNRGLVETTSTGWQNRSIERSLTGIHVAERFSPNHYVMADIKDVYRVQGASVSLLGLPSCENSVQFVVKNETLGSIWAYCAGVAEIWKIEEEGFKSFVLPEPVQTMTMWNDRVIARADRGNIYQFHSEAPHWRPLVQSELGLPEGRWNAVPNLSKYWPKTSDRNGDELLSCPTDENCTLIDDKGEPTSIRWPDLPFLANINQLFKIKKGVYLLTTTNDGGVFLGDGRNWKKIVDPVQVLREFPDVGSFYVGHLGLDPGLRLWLGGKPMNLLQLSLDRYLNE